MLADGCHSLRLPTIQHKDEENACESIAVQFSSSERETMTGSGLRGAQNGAVQVLKRPQKGQFEVNHICLLLSHVTREERPRAMKDEVYPLDDPAQAEAGL